MLHEGGEGYAARHGPKSAWPRGVARLARHLLCRHGQLAADGFVEPFFARSRRARLGPCWLSLKAGLANKAVNPITFAVLDAVDGDGKIRQHAAEHLEMFMLLGDPALVLATIPATLKLKTPETLEAGEVLSVEGTAPAALEGAAVRVSLERPLASTPTDLQPLRDLAGADRARAMLANHERANAFVLVVADVKVKDGRFAVSLKPPAKLPWKELTLRAYAATEKAEGMGVGAVNVK